MNKYDNKCKQAVNILRDAELDARKGLPAELFLLVSSLVPIPNVDLLIVNDSHQILLTRRNDPFFQYSWHIPGGCMRVGESFEERIQETAKNEIGTIVTINSNPIAVRNVIRGKNMYQEHPNERMHNVAIMFRCKLPDGFVIDNGMLNENDNGFIKWFDKLPDDFMRIQHVYDDVLKPWLK